MSIGWFVDGSFIYKSYPGQIDYSKLRSAIEEHLGDRVDEGYYFNSNDDSPGATAFNNYLTLPPPRGPGLRLKLYAYSRKKLYWPQQLGGQPVLHPDNDNIHYELRQQKGVDVGLAYHMIRSFHKRKWDKLVLCAGDSDFHEPVQNLVESENVDLYLVGGMNSISSELRAYAKGILEIDEEPLFSRLSRYPVGEAG